MYYVYVYVWLQTWAGLKGTVLNNAHLVLSCVYSVCVKMATLKDDSGSVTLLARRIRPTSEEAAISAQDTVALLSEGALSDAEQGEKEGTVHVHCT